MPTRDRRPDLPCLLAAQSAAQIVADELRCDVKIKVQRWQPVTLARNVCVGIFLDEPRATHLWFVDDDTMVPRSALKKLLALDADMAGGIVPCFDRNRMCVNVQRDGEGWLAPWPEGIFKATHVGTACMLVKRHIFENMPHPWFVWREAADGFFMGEDVIFSEKVTAMGGSIMVDSSVRCDHFKEVALARFCPDSEATYAGFEA